MLYISLIILYINIYTVYYIFALVRSRWTEIRRSIGQWWTPLLYSFQMRWSSLCWQVLILNSSMFPSFTIHFVRMFTTSNFKFTLINTIQHHLCLTTPTNNWDSVGILLSSIYLHHQQYTVYLIPHQNHEVGILAPADTGGNFLGLAKLRMRVGDTWRHVWKSTHVACSLYITTASWRHIVATYLDILYQVFFLSTKT